MNRIFFIIIIAALFGSCKKEETAAYSSSDNVYFDFDPQTKDRDSVIYTFAYTPGLTEDTVFLPVRLSGIHAADERSYGVEVVNQRTTAEVNTHYAPLASSYTIGSDTGKFWLPVILYNTDPLLSERSVTLVLRLTPGELGTADTSIITAKIVFSNKLEKPIWWEMWLGPYYSQVKHQLFLISSGTTDLTLSGLDAPKNLYHTGKLNSFLNDPFKWLEANPDSGYMLTLRDDGDYDFYNVNTPAKKILYKKNVQANKFYFIDEQGIEVI